MRGAQLTPNSKHEGAQLEQLEASKVPNSSGAQLKHQRCATRSMRGAQLCARDKGDQLEA